MSELLEVVAKNYYNILGVLRTVSQLDIKKAFRRLALRYHPDKNGNKKATDLFKHILEAYQVLGDCGKRSAYDRNSYPKQTFPQRYPKTPKPQTNTSTDSRRRHKSTPKTNSAEKPAPNKSTEHTVYVSLRDVLRGCTKRVKVTRMVWSSPQEFRKETEILSLDVKRGTKSGTRIVFAGYGNHPYGSDADDIALVVKEQPNHQFRREGNDIVYTAQMSLNEAIVGLPLTVPLLTGETMDVVLNRRQTIEFSEKCVLFIRKVGLGLPDQKHTFIRGDLLIKCQFKS
ncbi:unnamed protein product [Medioppia subpectinata]|uniref:J domain-containing protein n=1 Tax=Medioppia subpectinata TaxID=1979941 RepID=A0A7R9Q4H5_9ACAR|nr:unnamed protein product [Medioppia subpectinata]CAG2111452.1 unnamed protein product [Medioppia subpectinata]